MHSSVLLYLHVPKTAGVSVSSALSSRFGKDEIAEVSGPDYLASEQAVFGLDNARKNKLGLVFGHFSYGLHRAFDRPCGYYTILRNPLDRLVSLYYYTRSNPKHPRQAQARQLGLAEYATSRIHPELENCQTKMISGRPECNFISGSQPCTQEDLDLAKSHLRDSFVSVGLFEEMDQSLHTLCMRLGWDYTPAKKKNVTAARKSLAELTSTELAALRKVNEFDLQLYDYAVELSREQRNELSLPKRLGWLRHSLSTKSVLSRR